MLKKYLYIAALIFAYTGANAVNYKQICDQNLSTACDFILKLPKWNAWTRHWHLMRWIPIVVMIRSVGSNLS